MKKYKNIVVLGIVLIGLSFILNAIHFMIFNDLHHILIFLLADIAFIPLEVFFVSIVLERIIEKRDQQQIMKKINMLVGLFYQELGNQLLSVLVKADECTDDVNKIEVDFTWTQEEYYKLSNKINDHNHSIDIHRIDLEVLFSLLEENKSMIIQLIMNPSLQEHETFSDVLMSSIHLYDELIQRNIHSFTADDFAHLKVDVERVYKNLSKEWVTYMNHLQYDYPYLFLTAIKSNPYDNRNKKIIEKEALINYR